MGLKQWVVIDFRSSVPDQETIAENVWYVVYADKYASFTLYRAHEAPITIERYQKPVEQQRGY